MVVAAPKRQARTGSPSSIEEFGILVVVSRDMVSFSLLCLVLSLSLVSLLTWGGEPLISEFDDLRWQLWVRRWPSMKDWRGMEPGWEKFGFGSAWRGRDPDLSDGGANGDHDSWVFVADLDLNWLLGRWCWVQMLVTVAVATMKVEVATMVGPVKVALTKLAFCGFEKWAWTWA